MPLVNNCRIGVPRGGSSAEALTAVLSRIAFDDAALVRAVDDCMPFRVRESRKVWERREFANDHARSAQRDHQARESAARARRSFGQVGKAGLKAGRIAYKVADAGSDAAGVTPLGIGVKVGRKAVRAARGRYKQHGIEKHLGFLSEHWNARGAHFADDADNGEMAGACEKLLMRAVEFSFNPMLGRHGGNVYGLAAINAPATAEKRAEAIKHNVIVEQVLPFVCQQALIRHEKARKQAHGRGSGTLSKARAALGWYRGDRGAARNAAADVLAAHMLKCECAFTRDLLTHVLGSGRLESLLGRDKGRDLRDALYQALGTKI